MTSYKVKIRLLGLRKKARIEKVGSRNLVFAFKLNAANCIHFPCFFVEESR